MRRFTTFTHATSSTSDTSNRNTLATSAIPDAAKVHETLRDRHGFDRVHHLRRRECEQACRQQEKDQSQRTPNAAFEIFSGVTDPFLTGEHLLFNPATWGYTRTAPRDIDPIREAAVKRADIKR